MIIVKLKGGLGNQMFQYAFGKKNSIEQKTNLKLDKTFLELPIWQRLTGITVRNYELGEFNVKAQFSGFWEKMHPVLDGYWQSEKYFKNIRNIICRDFTIKNKSKNFIHVLNIISGTNSVSIHFRRGDYAWDEKTNKYHGLLGIEYYRKAIDIIQRKMKNPHFFIFSDDPTWVKNNFKIKKPVTHISDFSKLTNAEELVLMSHCEHNIIANSSFSWWGAWLNKNPKKIVIAPKKWFKARIDDKDIVPTGWIRI